MILHRIHRNRAWLLRFCVASVLLAPFLAVEKVFVVWPHTFTSWVDGLWSDWVYGGVIANWAERLGKWVGKPEKVGD